MRMFSLLFFCVFVSFTDSVTQSLTYSFLILTVLNWVFFEDLVDLRLQVVHERLQRVLQAVLVALDKLSG